MIPEKQRCNLVHEDAAGYSCWRSRIAKLNIPYRLTDIENKVDVLFRHAPAIVNKENPTFILHSQEETK